MKILAYDTFNDNTVSSDEEGAVFTFKNGKWSVKYIREKNFNNDGIEIDAPVEIESDEIEIVVYEENLKAVL